MSDELLSYVRRHTVDREIVPAELPRITTGTPLQHLITGNPEPDVFVNLVRSFSGGILVENGGAFDGRPHISSEIAYQLGTDRNTARRFMVLATHLSVGDSQLYTPGSILLGENGWLVNDGGLAMKAWNPKLVAKPWQGLDSPDDSLPGRRSAGAPWGLPAFAKCFI